MQAEEGSWGGVCASQDYVVVKNISILSHSQSH